MSSIEERLDKVRELIQDNDFLDSKGLSNEVNIRIFCYDPEDPPFQYAALSFSIK